MYLSVLKAQVHRWFTQQVRVDDWSLDVPSTLVTYIDGQLYPANTGTQVPIRDISIKENLGVGAYVMTMVLPYAVRYRFTNALSEHEVPVNELSTLYTNTVISWLQKGTQLDPDILNAGIAGIIESPIIVSRTEDTGNDWLVYLLFEFSIECIIDPEVVSSIQPLDPNNTDPPPIDVNEIRFGLWRSKMKHLGDQTKSFKDASGVIDMDARPGVNLP